MRAVRILRVTLHRWVRLPRLLFGAAAFKEAGQQAGALVGKHACDDLYRRTQPAISHDIPQ
jgi:hypothetical protein